MLFIGKKFFILFAISISLPFIFYFFILNPNQRNIIFKEVFSNLPITKNFITKSYKSNIYNLTFQEATDLKTASWAVDQLVNLTRINDEGKIEKYIAIYPYIAEAGFDLSETTVEMDNKNSISLTFNHPKLINVDVDEKKNLTIIRDNFEGYYDETLQPVKMAYHKAVEDIALNSDLFENAKQNAKEYFISFWSKMFKNVSVNFKKQNHHYLKKDIIHSTLSLKSNESFFAKYEIVPGDYDEYDVLLKKGNDGYITFHFAENLFESYRYLKQSLLKKIRNNSSFFLVNYAHPLSPKTKSWYGLISPDLGMFFGFTLNKNQLYSVTADTYNKQANNDIFSDAMRIISTVERKDHIYLKKDYLDFRYSLNACYKHLQQGHIGSFCESAKKIRNKWPSNYTKILYAISQTLKNNEFHKTEDDYLNSILHAWLSTKNDKFLDKHQKAILNNCNEYGKKIFKQYLYINHKRFQIPTAKVEELSIYMTENNLLSKEILMNIEFDHLQNLLASWTTQRIEKFYDKYGWCDSFRARALFTDVDGTNTYYWAPNEYPYYDEYALDNLHKNNKKLVDRRLNKLFEEIDWNVNAHELFKIVLTRKEGLLRNVVYDVFLFDSTDIYVIQDIFENANIYSFEYENIPIGSDIFKANGIEYKNATLFYLVNELFTKFNKSRNQNINTQFENMIKNDWLIPRIFYFYKVVNLNTIDYYIK